MTEGPSWSAGLALAGGLLILATSLLTIVAFEWPWLLVGLDADSLRPDRMGHAVPGLLHLAWALAAGLLPAAGGWRMAGPDPAGPQVGYVVVAGGLLAFPALGGAFLGAHAAVLGGALHLVEARART